MLFFRHFHTPYLPKIAGLENFKGTVMHSCEYRVPEAFQDKNVLIIGAKTSAMDVASEIMTCARQVRPFVHKKTARNSQCS